MNSLTDIVRTNYKEHGLNCSESIIRGANEFYHLNLHDEDMKMLSGFSSGMYVGSVCGALVACNAVISKLIVSDKAHSHLDALRPSSALLHQNFRQAANHSDCAKIKPNFYSKEEKCLKTVTMASEVLEKTISELVDQGLIHLDLQD